MKEESENLKQLVETLHDRYKEMDETLASKQLSEDKWSIKEIFGHLIDSAANNYQRFVRLQESETLDFPGYDYMWVKVIPYNSCPWNTVLSLWKNYNDLLVHIIENIQDKSRRHQWHYQEEELSLDFLVKDYIEHMKIHEQHLTERLDEIQT